MIDPLPANPPLHFSIVGQLAQRIHKLAAQNDITPRQICQSALRMYVSRIEDATLNTFPEIDTEDTDK